MMDWTDRHCRILHRQIVPDALLYTEMVTTGALLFGDNPQRFLAHDPRERPLALQLGGSEPNALGEAVKRAAPLGFDEINLNVGCPSDRVRSGRFGACLMAEPELVAECVRAMREASDLPVTVKTRIGIDDSPEPEFLERFVERVAAAGTRTFIVHARKAWLKGLSPKQNREIPPLRYDLVHALKRDRPDLEIVINGGIATTATALAQLAHVDGVMIGREAYSNPMFLAQLDRAMRGSEVEGGGRAARTPDPWNVVEAMAEYAESAMADGTTLHAIARHMVGLFNGRPGARAYRRTLSELAGDRRATPRRLIEAAALVRRDARRGQMADITRERPESQSTAATAVTV